MEWTKQLRCYKPGKKFKKFMIHPDRQQKYTFKKLYTVNHLTLTSFITTPEAGKVGKRVSE